MASTDINGTYNYMYLVTRDESFNGHTIGWDLVSDGSGDSSVNPVASQVTVSGAPDENGHVDNSPFHVSVAGDDRFTFVSSAETTPFGHGFIVSDTASGQYYFVTNQAYTGANNVFAAQLSAQRTDPPAPACLLAGTRISTPSGEAAVETIQPGDLVFVAGGGTSPVAWVGRRTLTRRFLEFPHVLPIRIRAHALATNVPSRDLLISPDHAVFLDGSLFQAGALVNGMSIVREADAPEVFTYYHVELDDHSLILAEGVPVETFIDHVDRMAFENWEEHRAAYPSGKSIAEMPYPRAKAHRQVPRALREHLIRRADAVFGPGETALVA